MIPLEHLLATAPTGSLHFHQGSNAESCGIAVAEASRWSHVALIVRPEDIGRDATGGPWVWEATALSNLPDALRGTHATGTQIVDLGARVRTDFASGHTARQAVRFYGGPPLGADGARVLLDEVERSSGIPFPGLIGLADGYLRHLAGRSTPTDETVCTDLVAATLQRLGWLSDVRPPNAYSIHDFEPGERLDRDARRDARWGPMVGIVSPAEARQAA